LAFFIYLFFEVFSNDNFLSKNRYAAEGGPVCLKMPEPNSCPSPPLSSMEQRLLILHPELPLNSVQTVDE
jgi:hypothetical protein